MPIYVQHEVLGRVPDVFNAEAIWQAPGLALFSRRPLLRDLLERSPREHRGRAATRCFSHVTLMLPQEEVDDDYHLTRGARARDLAQTLTALHRKDFGDLLGADQVRYDVIGTEALAPGQIEVKFGHAVYLPAADEKILYDVSVSRDSAVWKPVCPIYPNQRLALIGGDHGSASFMVPGWPFGDDGAILLINDGPDAPVDVQMRPKDAFHCSFDARSGYYTIRSARATETGSNQRLLLKIARVGAASSQLAPAETGVHVEATLASPALAPTLVSSLVPASVPASGPIKLHGAMATPTRAAVWQARPAPSARTDPEQTALPASHRPRPQPNAGVGAGTGAEGDVTFAPIAPASRQRVSLVALALPRLSRYRDTGASALEIPFDASLAIAAGAQRSISFIVNGADELLACTEAGRQRITAPAEFAPVDSRAIRVLAVPDEMADRYCATLHLPLSVDMPVASGARFVFGRGAPMLAALRLLDSSRFLQHAGGADSGASADRIGLSRNAFSFEAAPGGFHVARLSATQALYHLDETLRFVAKVSSGAEAPYFLPTGHHLVAGHYVMRFDSV